eukprot:TRINITY_DN6976_c0_g1_i9.p1 TRINITY_DN6976_c0_g1~~TRINITY_DN6976_c0_g1_i9.p1  ORF type:complete len:350 (+),score=58.50 TRINITY_DN6976_c0_g1_i9:76-1125(+)
MCIRDRSTWGNNWKMSYKKEVLDYFFSFSESFGFSKSDGGNHETTRELIFEISDKLESIDPNSQKEAIEKIHASILHFTKDGRLKVNTELADELIYSDSSSLLLNFLSKTLNLLQETSDGEEKQNLIELIFATLNILSVIHVHSSKFSGINVALEEICMKFISMSIEMNYVPLKKVVGIFWLYLNELCQIDKSTRSDVKELTENYLTDIFKGKPRYLVAGNSDTEKFYQRVVMPNENPLAQVIVVGLLRGLLTTCNSPWGKQSTGHKDQSGVDIHFEWKLPYITKKDDVSRELMEKNQFVSKLFNDFEEYFTQSGGVRDDSLVKGEAERHRLIIAFFISSIFLLSLIHI